MRKSGCKDFKLYAQGHTASKWVREELNPALTLEFMLLTTRILRARREGDTIEAKVGENLKEE